MVDIIKAFRIRQARGPALAVVVGWCRLACGWRWHLEWADGSNGPWSGASYRTKEEALSVARAAQDLGVAA